MLFYGDNTEFRNPFREGETLFGAALRVDADARLSQTATLKVGFFGDTRFGGASSFESVRPVVALTVAGRRSTFVFGTLPASGTVATRGPDLDGPHGLLPPIQRETLTFERPYEAGLQWTFSGAILEHHAWLNWQRLNTPAHRERFDAGLRTTWWRRRAFAIPVQAHVVHEGGQRFSTGAVRDSVAAAAGIALSTPARNDLSAGLELFGLWSRYTPDREMPGRTFAGAGFFGRSDLRYRGWRAHLIMWRGDDVVTDEGDPNYLSIRRDGRRYRGVRDYAEAGVTRTFRPAPSTAVEASFRLHRVERHYEYSYRILARTGFRLRLIDRENGGGPAEEADAEGRQKPITTPTFPVQ